MNDRIDVRVEIDEACEQPQLIIRTARRTEMVDNIIHAAKECAENTPSQVTVYDGENAVSLDQSKISRVYTENRRVVVCSASGRYVTRMTLQELELLLGKESFVRISRFEIVNLRKVTGFDFSSAGTIRVTFRDGSRTWVARRYVQTIQKTLKAGVSGKEGV